MIVEPKVKGFICTTAHPVGCEENVRRQIAYCKEKGQIDGPKKVLVIGGSTGYGLASRIAVTYGYGADTISVAFEKEAKGKRTASAGWYNTKAFEKLAKEDGYYAKSFNGDGFSAEMKQQVIEAIKRRLGQSRYGGLQLGSAEKDHAGWHYRFQRVKNSRKRIYQQNH